MTHDNINIESISYETQWLKVIIKTYDSLERDIASKAYLFAEEDDKEYVLNCYSINFDIIECYSKKDEHVNLDNHYYFYCNKIDSHLTLMKMIY